MMTALRRFTRRALAAALGLALYAGAAPGAPAARAAASTREVTILATTDFHGALVSGGRDRATNRPFGGAVALAQFVRRERGLRPDRTFLLDGGDEMQGTPESNFVFGQSAVAVLNALGVDAAALGNHEFDWGIDSLRARVAEMHYTLLAANVFEAATGKRPPWVKPWTIVERDGVKLGVIGFATPDTPRVTLPFHVRTLRFDAPEPMVANLAREVRRQGADLVVVVCHIGGEQGDDGEIRGEVADLAAAARGVDAIVGGHTHTFVAGRSHGIPVVIAGSSARALGRIILDWDGRRATAKSVTLARTFSDSLQVPDWDPFVALVDSMRERVRPYVTRVLGRSEKPLRRTALANLITDAMRSSMQADVAITNPGGIRRDLDAGPITAGDVFELLPFENSLVEIPLTGAQLRAVVASRPEKTCVSGLRGRWDPQAAPEARLTLTLEDGSPLRDDATYRVITTNFLASGGDGFKGFDAGPQKDSPLLVRDVVAQALEAATAAGQPISPDPAPRFQLPESAQR